MIRTAVVILSQPCRAGICVLQASRGQAVSEHERSLRCLALNDEAVIESLLGMQLQPTKTSGLDVFLL
jgi:hypothetical protein